MESRQVGQHRAQLRKGDNHGQSQEPDIFDMMESENIKHNKYHEEQKVQPPMHQEPLEDWDQFSEQIMRSQGAPPRMHDDEDRLSDVKQALINKEILEKGHAPQDFDYYLQQVKADSHDLRKWGLEELKSVIAEFQDHQFAISLDNEEMQQHQQSYGGGQQAQSNPKMTPQGVPMISNEKVTEILPFLRSYVTGPTLKVKQLVPNALNKHLRALKILVSNPRVVEVKEFLFIKLNQLQVVIFTTPLKWETIRAESDFYILRKVLQLQFPHLLIPPLPSKQEQKFTFKSMTNRCVKLTRFIQALCRSDELCTFPLLNEFLQVKHKDQKVYSEKLKNEEAMLLKTRVPTKPEIGELSSMYEKVSTKLNPEALAFDLPTFIDRYESLIKSVIEDSQLVKAKAKGIHEAYLKFQEILMRKSAFHENDSIQQLEIYGHLSKIFGTDAFILSQQGDAIADSMKYLKYNIEFAHSLRDLQVKGEHTKQRFLKAEKNFQSKKEKVVTQLGQQNHAKVSGVLIDQMLPVETQELEQSTQLMHYFANQVLQEVRRMQYQMEYPGMAENFKLLIKSYTEGLNQRSMQWSNVGKILSNTPNQKPEPAIRRGGNTAK